MHQQRLCHRCDAPISTRYVWALISGAYYTAVWGGVREIHTSYQPTWWFPLPTIVHSPVDGAFLLLSIKRKIEKFLSLIPSQNLPEANLDRWRMSQVPIAPVEPLARCAQSRSQRRLREGSSLSRAPSRALPSVHFPNRFFFFQKISPAKIDVWVRVGLPHRRTPATASFCTPIVPAVTPSAVS